MLPGALVNYAGQREEAFPLTRPRYGAENEIIAFISEAVHVRTTLPANPPLPRIARAWGPAQW